MVCRPAANAGDAMSVSVLLEAPDGSLTPRSTDALFRTGDRFRVKMLGSRDARISLFNTNPRGELGAEPVWRGELRVGQELITPRLALTVPARFALSAGLAVGRPAEVLLLADGIHVMPADPGEPGRD